MEPELLRFLLCNWQKTSLHFPLSATPVILQRLASDEVESSQEGGVSVADVATQEEAEVNSKELVKAEEVNRVATINMTLEVVAEVLVEDDDLDGRITTSHNEIVMHLSILNRIGKCWRRLISTVWLS
jgi:hypothetical protein